MEKEEVLYRLGIHIRKLREGKIKGLTKIQFKYFVKITLEEDESVPVGQFRFFSKKTQKELTDEIN